MERREVDLPHDKHRASPAGEDGPLLAPHLRLRLPQGRAHCHPPGPERDVPSQRPVGLPHHPARPLPRPLHDLLARQQREPQRRPQRELRPRAHGALLHGHRQLHRGRHQDGRQGLHRMDLPAAHAPVPLRPLPVTLRLPRRRPRPQRKDLSSATPATSTARTSSTSSSSSPPPPGSFRDSSTTSSWPTRCRSPLGTPSLPRTPMPSTP